MSEVDKQVLYALEKGDLFEVNGPFVALDPDEKIQFVVLDVRKSIDKKHIVKLSAQYFDTYIGTFELWTQDFLKMVKFEEREI